MYTKLLYIFLILITTSNLFSQNLVTNGDFEILAPGYCARPYDATYCGYFELATGWFNSASCSGGSTSDHICNPNNSSLWNLPLVPPSGVGVMGVGSGLGTSEFSEAFETTLSSSQPPGTTINVTFQVSPRNSAISSGSPNDPNILFGVYFFNTGNVPEVVTGSFGVGHHLSATPQIIYPTTGLTMDAWSTVSQNYTLTATTSKIAIGFFNPAGNASNPGARYFAIDDVVVTVVPPPCPPVATGSGGSASVCGGGAFSFPARTCSSGTLRWYENSSGTGSFYTGASVTPAATTTYYPFCFSTCLSPAGNPATATVTCPVSGSGSTWIWTGCQSTDWFNSCNWDRGNIPNSTSLVIIPNTTNKPVISGAVANCYDITLQSSLGATITINSSGGGMLNVTKP